MTKRMIAPGVLLVLCMSMLLGCARTKSEQLVGTWEMLGANNAPTGITLTFTDDGTMYYGTLLTIDYDNELVQQFFSSRGGELLAKVLSENKTVARYAMEKLVKPEYRVRNASRLQVKMHLILGIFKVNRTLRYELDRDSLTLDGFHYARQYNFD